MRIERIQPIQQPIRRFKKCTLGWCANCNEKSIYRKRYKRKDGTRGMVDFCINKHCKSHTEKKGLL